MCHKTNNLKKHANELLFSNLETNLSDAKCRNPKFYWNNRFKLVLTKENENKCDINAPIKNTNNGINSIVTSDIEKANGLNAYFLSICNADATDTLVRVTLT